MTTLYINTINLTMPVDHKVTEAPRNNSASGYGSKIPTQYMIKFRNRWRRVYAICYSNCATLYVTVRGERCIVNEYSMEPNLPI